MLNSPCISSPITLFSFPAYAPLFGAVCYSPSSLPAGTQGRSLGGRTGGLALGQQLLPRGVEALGAGVWASSCSLFKKGGTPGIFRRRPALALLLEIYLTSVPLPPPRSSRDPPLGCAVPMSLAAGPPGCLPSAQGATSTSTPTRRLHPWKRWGASDSSLGWQPWG